MRAIRYRAWWVAADRNTGVDCDPDLVETRSRIFESLESAAQYARAACVIGDPRVYVERYSPFRDHESGKLIPHWEEEGVYYVDPATGEAGEIDQFC